jgi:hypothetical protein
MDRARFYELIDAAREGVEDTAPSADADELRTALDALDDEDLQGFVTAFDAELARLNRWSVWEAGFVASGGMNAVDFRWFRAWLVGKGLAAVETALTAPDDLADLLGEDEAPRNERLEYTALEAVDERGLPDPRTDADAAPSDADPEGEPFDSETADERLPRLAAARRRLVG